VSLDLPKTLARDGQRARAGRNRSLTEGKLSVPRRHRRRAAPSDDEEQPARHGSALAAARRRAWISLANVALLRLPRRISRQTTFRRARGEDQSRAWLHDRPGAARANRRAERVACGWLSRDLTLEEAGWMDPFGLCLRDKTVRDLGTGTGFTSDARTDHPGAAAGGVCGCRRCCGTQSETQHQRGGYGKQ
jgi:hypothetical protein